MSGQKTLLCSTLAVLLFPLMCQCIDQVTVSVGQTATLTCHVEIQGTVQVGWRDKNGNQLTWNTEVYTEDRRFSVKRPYQNDWDLQIDGVRLADAGQYLCCVVITRDCQPIKTITLVVQIPPTIVGISSDVTLSTGASATLVCNASGVPVPTVRWLLHRPSTEGREVATGAEYQISNAQRSDAGRYECSANNGVLPSASLSLQVTVTFKPQVLLPYREIRQALDSDTLLECLVRSNPTGDLYWERDGRRLENNAPGKYRFSSRKGSDNTETFLELTIYSLQTEDFGWYTCVAKNDVGIAVDSASISAWHNGTLRMLSTPKDVIAQTGQNAVIDCAVEGMTNDDRLTWWRQDSKTGPYVKIFDSSANGSRLALDADRYQEPKYSIVGQYNLVVKSVVLEDAGNYECHVLGLGNYSAVLTTVSPDSTSDANCSGPLSSASVTMMIAVVASVVVFFVVAFGVVVFLIVRHYRGEVAKSKRSGHNLGTMPGRRTDIVKSIVS